jgi:hypothetical protein
MEQEPGLLQPEFFPILSVLLIFVSINQPKNIALKFHFYATIILLVAVAACVRQSPQLPANKFIESDSTALILSQSNEKLIQSEDSILKLVLESRFKSKMTAGEGFWYLVESNNSLNKKLQKGEKVTIEYEIFDLENNLLLKKSETITIGQQQLKPALEQVLIMLTKGDKAVILLPWYSGYGVKGDGDKIPPYTSLIVKMKYVQ